MMNTEDRKNEDALRSAYEADKKLKKNKADELKDARDYVSVLLKEIEVRNDELGSAKSDSEDIKRKLDEIEHEFVITKQSEISARKKHSFFVFLAIIEGLVIAALVVMLLIKGFGSAGGDEKAGDGDQQVPSETTQEDPAIPGTDDDGDTDFYFDPGADARSKYVEDLAKVAEAYNSSSSEFKASVESVDGLEHLCLSDGELKILYKNEYISSSDPFRKSVTIERGDLRLEIAGSYELEGEAASFAPRKTKIGGKKMLVFTGSEGREQPVSLMLVDTDELAIARVEDVAGEIKDLVQIEFFENIEELENSEYYKNNRSQGFEGLFAGKGEDIENNVFFTLTAGEKTYLYCVSAEVYNDIRYYEIDPPVFEGGIGEEISGKGISYKAVVALDEKQLLGKLKTVIKMEDGRPKIVLEGFEAYGVNMTTDVENPVLAPVEELKEEYRTGN